MNNTVQVGVVGVGEADGEPAGHARQGSTVPRPLWPRLAALCGVSAPTAPVGSGPGLGLQALGARLLLARVWPLPRLPRGGALASPELLATLARPPPGALLALYACPAAPSRSPDPDLGPNPDPSPGSAAPQMAAAVRMSLVLNQGIPAVMPGDEGAEAGSGFRGAQDPAGVRSPARAHSGSRPAGASPGGRAPAQVAAGSATGMHAGDRAGTGPTAGMAPAAAEWVLRSLGSEGRAKRLLELLAARHLRGCVL